jgi:hypothetical protein
MVCQAYNNVMHCTYDFVVVTLLPLNKFKNCMFYTQFHHNGLLPKIASKYIYMPNSIILKQIGSAQRQRTGEKFFR